MPAHRTEVYSTAEDNQKSIELTIYMGESLLVKRNIKLASFEISNLPKGKRGEPQLKISLDVDEECKVKLIAKEKETRLKVNTKNYNFPKLTSGKIKKLLLLYEKNKVEDQSTLKIIEAKNRADQIISKAERCIRENQKHGLSLESNKKIDKALASLGIALDSNDDEKIRLKVEELEGLLRVNVFDDFSRFGGAFGQFFQPSSFGPKGTQTNKEKDKTIKNKMFQSKKKKVLGIKVS